MSEERTPGALGSNDGLGLVERLRDEAQQATERANFLLAITRDAQEIAATLAADRERLRVDAMRYRKLRAQQHSMTPRVVAPFDDRLTFTPEGLDAALDALPDPKKA